MSDVEPNADPSAMDCSEVRDLLYLYSCGELDVDESKAVEVHVSSCVDCSKALEEHGILKRVLPTGFVSRKLFYYSRDA